MKEIINDPNATLVDVRTAEEYAMGNVPGSINIPLDQVPARVDEFKEMSKPLVLFCAAGGRSGQAIAFLQQNGVDGMHNGGGWQDVMANKN